MGSDRTKPKSQDPRLFDHKQTTRGTSSPYQTTPEPSSEWPAEATKSSQFQSSEPQSPARQPRRTNLKPQYPQRQQPGLIELQRYDPRYPGLLLQPDSRPISQEQIASEVKSIYAGLTMVETKCIQVDRTQAAAASKNIDTKLASDRWQALIALHLTLLHEHHDFFLASQHQSASPAVRRLAGKLSMPARMWKHGIGSFLELLKRRLPDSIDYMLAFIYLAYQMIALFYETVPDFEDTWIECLGDLGRYRMAIEDEDVRDRKIWAGVARSWFTKAADKNPTVGRFYHHLATLEHPNALQQVYYYSRSLTCVRPFPDARESISILFDRVLGRVAATYTHALPIDTNFIRAHAVLFENQDPQKFHESKTEFMDSLDNHIGRVTAKWKAQGVYIAVTNFASWFGYGTENVDTAPSTLHEAILHFLEKDFSERNPVVTILTDLRDPKRSDISKKELSEIYRDYLSRRDKFDLFRHARLITYETSAIVLRRIGDPNVLPYVHVTLAFLIAFASDEFLADRIKDAPWAELVTFLDRLVKERTKLIQAQTIDALLATDVFPAQGERGDELPLPEDYLVRGLTWSQHYFPKEWFKREHDEEERYFELERTVENRMDRVLRLGVQLSNVGFISNPLQAFPLTRVAQTMDHI
jgi:hypothetical protein